MNSFNRGYGFRPTDEELIDHLRNRTTLGCNFLVQEITVLGVDFCHWEPWELFGDTNTVTSSDGARYFIYPKTYKYSECKTKTKKPNEGANGKGKVMVNRATKQGKWKPSGDPRKVRDSDSNKEIGLKRGLYFYIDQVNEENNKKSKANHGQTSYQNKSNNKKSKTKHQNSYQNKTPWVLYEYELVDVPPSKNKFVLGKLMKQSKPTNKSSNNGETSHQLPPDQVQLDIHEPLEEMEVSNGTQNQSSISEQANEIVSSFPIYNCTTFPEGFGSNQENFVNDVNPYEVSKLPFTLENYVADYAIPPNLEVEYMKLITAPELPNMYTGPENQLNSNQYDNSFQNLVSLHNNETYPVQSSDQQNVLVETQGFNWPYDSNNHPTVDLSQMNFLELDDLYGDRIYLAELFGPLEAPNNYDGVQNQSSINQHADEFRNLNSVNNHIAFPDERNESAAAETEGSNLPSLGMTESSYPIMESFRKRSRVENEGSSIEIENEVAQAQAKISRFQR